MANRSNMFLMMLTAAMLAGGWAVTGITVAAAADESAEKIFDELFGSEVKRVSLTRDTADDLALAKTLLGAVETAKEQASLVEVLCDNAFTLASRDTSMKGLNVAVEAMEKLATLVPAKAVAADEKVVDMLRGSYARAADEDKAFLGNALIDRYMAAAKRLTATGDHGGAAKIYQRAQFIARQIESPNLAVLEQKYDEANQRETVARKVSLLHERVASDPSNATLRKELIELYIIELDDPASALPHVKASGDAELQKFVPLAAKGDSVSAESGLDLGDWYYKLGKDASSDSAKRRLLSRSSDYLSAFLADAANASGLHKAKATLTLNRVKGMLDKIEPRKVAVKSPVKHGTTSGNSTTKPVSKPGKPMDLFEDIETIKHSVVGTWEKKGSRIGSTVNVGSREAWINTPMQPTGEYEVQFRFTKTAGRAAVKVYLPLPFVEGYSSSYPAGMSATFGANDGKFSMFERGKGSSYYYSYDDASSYNNPTIQGAVRFTNGKTYSIKVVIKNNGGEVEATAYLSGRKFLAWKGKPSTLPGYSYSSKIDGKAVGFAVYNNIQRSAAVFSSGSIKSLSGEVKNTAKKSK